MSILDDIPPNSMQAERQVLSAMLLNKDVMQNLIAEIETGYFYHSNHAKIFSVMKQYGTVDIAEIALHEPETDQTIGDLLELGAFRDCSDSVDILKDMFVRREMRSELIRALVAAQSDFESSASDQINRVYDKMFQLTNKGQKFEPKLIADYLPQFWDDLNEQRKTGIESRSIITGLPCIDENLCIEPGDLIILGARPSMGKSSLASCISRHNAISRKKSIAYFSVEMGARTQVKRDIFAEANCSLFAFNKGILPMRDYSKLSMAAGPMSEAKIWIDAEPSITPMKIQSKCNFIKSKTGLDLIVVDYLQICRTDKKLSEKRLQVEDIAQSLKDIAKYFEVPVIALSQLSRDVDKRPDKRPVKSDLMESGAIEAIADIILFLYRDEVYYRDSEEPNVAELICAKQRNGMSEFYKKIFFDKNSMNFRELARDGA